MALTNAEIGEGVGALVADFLAEEIDEAALKSGLASLFAAAGLTANSTVAQAVAQTVAWHATLLIDQSAWWTEPADGGDLGGGMMTRHYADGSSAAFPVLAKILADLAGIVIAGTLEGEEDLPDAGSRIGEIYLIGGDGWVWSGSAWLNAGPIQGPVGKSAYEIAVEEGFVGNKAAWLASLDGEDGAAATIAAGTVTMVANGAPALVANSGTANAAVLDFELPSPLDGAPGVAATVAIGAVTTVANGAGSSVTNAGTANAAVLDIKLEAGPKGDKGDAFTVNAQGALAGRDAYDDEDEGFAYLATDEGLLYFRQGDPGDWSDGIAFGKGDPGEGVPAGGTTGQVLKKASGTDYATAWATLAIGDVSGLTGALSAKLASADFTWSNLSGKPSTFAPSAHTHAAGDITSGTLADARIPALAIAKITDLQDTLDGKVAASRTVATATGLSGGGALTADRTIALAVSALTEDASPDAGSDFLLAYDTSAAAHRKVRPANLGLVSSSSISALIAGVALQLAELKAERFGFGGLVADAFDDPSGVDAGASSGELYSAEDRFYTNLSGAPGPATTTSVPTMTSSVTSGWTASADSTLDPDETAAWKAFDRDNGFGWGSNGKTLPKWLRIQAPSAKTFVAFAVTAGLAAEDYAPKAFTFQGSSNGSSWSTLGTYTGLTWDSGERKTFTVTTPGAYTYYRLNVTTAGSGAEVVAIAEWELFELAPSEPGDMDLISVAYEALTAPSTGSMAVVAKPTGGSITPGTELQAYLSRDDGDHWAAATLIAQGEWPDGSTFYWAENIDLSGQPSGTDMRWRVAASDDFQIDVTAVLAAWRT